MEHNNNNAPHEQQNLHDQIARKCHLDTEIAKATATGKTPSLRRLRQMPPMLPVISEEDEFSDIESEGLPLRTNHERPSTNVNNLEFWGKLKDFCLDFYNYIACTGRQR